MADEVEATGPMDADEIAAILERVASATPGPWEAGEDWGGGRIIYATIDDGRAMHWESVWGGNLKDDAEFIAHAPADVRRLLAEVERQRRVIDRAEKANAALREIVGRVADMWPTARLASCARVCTLCQAEQGEDPPEERHKPDCLFIEARALLRPHIDVRAIPAAREE